MRKARRNCPTTQDSSKPCMHAYLDTNGKAKRKDYSQVLENKIVYVVLIICLITSTRDCASSFVLYM